MVKPSAYVQWDGNKDHLITIKVDIETAKAVWACVGKPVGDTENTYRKYTSPLYKAFKNCLEGCFKIDYFGGVHEIVSGSLVANKLPEEKPQVKELTVSEISNLLGYEVKVVK